MKELPRFTLRIDRELLDKLYYASDYEGRTVNKQIEQLIKRYLKEFEEVNGKITLSDVKTLKESKRKISKEDS